MLGDKACMLGFDVFSERLIRRILRQLSMTVLPVEEVSEQNVKLFICAVQTPDGNIDYSKMKEIEKVASGMKKNGQGRMVLLTNQICSCITNTAWNTFAAIQEAIIEYWKRLAVEMAEYSITCNVIEIGYMKERDHCLKLSSEASFFRRFSIRREVEDEDIRCALQFFLSEDSKFITGDRFVLDGGLELNQVTPPFRSKGKPENAFKQDAGNVHSFRFEGKTAIIFGCSAGIGYATAVEMAKRGANLSLHARRYDRLQKLEDEIKEHGTDCIIMKTDVQSQEQVYEAIDKTWEHFGKIDIMIYVSGIGYVTDELNDSKDYERMYQTNYQGYESAVKYLCNRWKKDEIKGAVVAVSTIDTMTVPSYGLASYSVTKAAMTQLTKSLSLVCAKYGIRLNCVAPGYIATEIMDFTTDEYRKQWVDKIPLGRLGKADDISGPICYLASSAADYVTGKNLLIDGGYSLMVVPELVQ